MSEQVALELNCAPLPLLAELACTATALLIPSWNSETLRYTPGRPRATIPPSKEAYAVSFSEPASIAKASRKSSSSPTHAKGAMLATPTPYLTFR
jgi:hypothetical protein